MSGQEQAQQVAGATVLDNETSLNEQDSIFGEPKAFHVVAFARYFDASRLDEDRRKEMSFSYGRRNDITRLLRHRHAGPCKTDDGGVWLDAVIPFIVEGAEVTGRSGIIDGLRWAYTHVPKLVEDIHPFNIAAHIDSTFDERDEAALAQANDAGRFVRWLPTMDDLCYALRPTRAEIATLELKGWRAVDALTEEERRVVNRERMRNRRRAEGRTPQAERTKTAGLQAIASSLGVSLRTVQRWQQSGTLMEKIAACPISSDIDVTEVCSPYIDKGGMHTCVTRPATANDDEAVRLSA